MISGKTQNRSKEFLAREVPSPECLLGIASSGPSWPSSLSIAPLPTTPRQARDHSSVLVSSRRDAAGGTSLRQFLARPLGGRRLSRCFEEHPTCRSRLPLHRQSKNQSTTGSAKRRRHEQPDAD